MASPPQPLMCAAWLLAACCLPLRTSWALDLGSQNLEARSPVKVMDYRIPNCQNPTPILKGSRGDAPHSTRPAARIRPLPTCTRHWFLAEFATRDLSSSGSGLATNRPNRIAPFGTLSCLRRVSCSSQPALCYRSLPCLRSLCRETWTVTWLEPRTRHQPEKLQKLPKNECVSTPAGGEVKLFLREISALFSIQCRPSTGACRKIVQARKGRTMKVRARSQFRGDRRRARGEIPNVDDRPSV